MAKVPALLSPSGACCPPVEATTTSPSGICCPPPGQSMHPRPMPVTPPNPCADAQPVTICGAVDPIPVDIVCDPLSIPYAKCDGTTGTATGTTCNLIQVVPHPDAVQKVQICNNVDRELVKMCNETTGEEILIQYDVTTAPPTILAATNLSTNTPYTGSLDDLVVCGTVEVEQEIFCDNGTTFIRWYVIDGTGKPTGAYWDTDLEGQPYTVSPQTTTYYKNGVQLTDPVAIAAAATAVASGTVVNCSPLEANATCYTVQETVTKTYAAVETLELGPGPAGTPIWLGEIQLWDNASAQPIPGATLTLNPYIQVWDGSSLISPAALKAALTAAGYLQFWQSVDPRIDRFDVVQVGSNLRVYLFDEENQYTQANRIANNASRFSNTNGGPLGGVNLNGAYSDVSVNTTVDVSYKVVTSEDVTIGKCKDCECLQSISDATGDDLSTLLPGTTFSFTKPECCVVKITTSIGSFTIRKNVTSFVTQEFKCPLSVTAVEIVSGTCTLDEVHIISNSSINTCCDC